MIEVSAQKKNKINLEDYDYLQDIKNRQLMASFSQDDVLVLEEILYSPIKCSYQRLSKACDMSEESLKKILNKLRSTDLFSMAEDGIHVDKDMRKYFEAQILKFDEDFTPGMDFLQSLLKKVPIHVLPNWYPIPRTSNNIFDSLVEKYLETPQTFQRYLSELNLGDEVMSHIVEDVFTAPEYKVRSNTIREKYGLSQAQFEEVMLNLEFNFVCCLVYEREGNEWHEVITLFHEWKEYLRFVQMSEPKEIDDEVVPFRSHDFAFIEDLSAVVKLCKKGKLSLKLNAHEQWEFHESEHPKLEKVMEDFTPEDPRFIAYLSRLAHKANFLKLARIEGSHLVAQEIAQEWLSLPKEKRALSAYKHTIQHYPYNEFPSESCTDRNLREIEKSITRVLSKGWVQKDLFLKSVLAPISETSKIVLKRKGRSWQYTLPTYTDEEKKLIEMITYEWMYEGGIISIGYQGNTPCMRVTSFGKSIFGQ